MKHRDLDFCIFLWTTSVNQRNFAKILLIIEVHMATVDPARFGEGVLSWSWRPEANHAVYNEHHEPIDQIRFNSYNEVLEVFSRHLFPLYNLCRYGIMGFVDKGGTRTTPKCFVVATDVESWTGPYLYGDCATVINRVGLLEHQTNSLNKLSRIPLVGIIASIGRVVLAVLHIIGHAFLALVTQNKGHLYHAAKGMVEIKSGLLDAVPILGRLRAYVAYHDGSHFSPTSHWDCIKIYNPNNPDLVDIENGLWNRPSPHLVTFRA